MMKALVINIAEGLWENSRGFELALLPEPSFDRHKDAKNVLIKVHYTGFCGTDRGMWNRETLKASIFSSLHSENKTIRIVGHECVGEIVEIGHDVEKELALKRGQIVSAESHLFCSTCFFCKRKQEYVCENEKIMGVTVDGCFAEYVKLPAHVIWPTNTKKIREEVAALQEPFGNAVHCASKVELHGRTIAIFGCGAIGQFLILIAKAHGVNTIIVVDPNERNRTLAQTLGADHVFTTESSPYHADTRLIHQIKEATNEHGVDASFEMSGFNVSVNNAIQATAKGGDIVLFGLKQGDFTIERLDSLILGAKKIHGVFGREIFKSWATTKELLEKTKNKIQEKIFNVILHEGSGTVLPIDSFSKVKMEELFREYPKIILKWN